MEIDQSTILLVIGIIASVTADYYGVLHHRAMGEAGVTGSIQYIVTWRRRKSIEMLILLLGFIPKAIPLVIWAVFHSEWYYGVAALFVGIAISAFTAKSAIANQWSRLGLYPISLGCIYILWDSVGWNL